VTWRSFRRPFVHPLSRLKAAEAAAKLRELLAEQATTGDSIDHSPDGDPGSARLSTHTIPPRIIPLDDPNCLLIQLDDEDRDRVWDLLSTLEENVMLRGDLRDFQRR
jgi:hypothetical protein